jgi:large subunit ribosomal protein L27
MGRTKGGSGAKNGRDSNPKHLGVKRFGGEKVSAGSILVKQRGTRIHPGSNVKRGTDDTLYSVVDGVVKYSERMNRKVVSVEAAESAAN